MTIVIFSGTYEPYGPIELDEAVRVLDSMGFRKMGEAWVRDDTYAHVRTVLTVDAMSEKYKE